MNGERRTENGRRLPFRYTTELQTAIVIGYTDDREATGPQTDLDRRRAEAVRDYLVSRHGIDPSRITVEGRDAREPVGDNNTAEGRLKNRRVVIRLLLP